MSTKLANLALDRMGLSPLRSISQQSRTADTIRRQLEKSADWVLRRRIWSEMLTIEELTKIPDAITSHDFPHAYNLPSGFVRAYRTLVGDECYYSGKDWRIINVQTTTGKRRALVVRFPISALEFTWRPEELASLPSDVRDVLVLHLAKETMSPLKVNESTRERINAEYEIALEDASSVSAQQDSEEIEIQQGDILDARAGMWGGMR